MHKHGIRHEVSYLIHDDSLLQNAWVLLQNVAAILLQNVAVILLQNVIEVYYKTHQVFYCKMRHLLQNAMFSQIVFTI